MNQDNRPRIGQLVRVRGVMCRIIAVHVFGTIDVEAMDDSGRCWRVSGLSYLNRGGCDENHA